MDWFTVIGLIVLGITFVVAEILFIPGVFVAGAIGVGLSGLGVYLSFDYFGTETGAYTLVIAVLLNIGALILTFRGNTWKRFSLQQVNSSKVNEDEFFHSLTIGMVGTTTSTLRPVGKAIFDDHLIEVKSNGEYIEENEKIEIVKINSQNQIIVKRI